MSIEQVLAAHLPRDRYDADGVHAGTYCTCGGWEGGYFADGEAGPFDGHLAAAIREYLLSDAVVEAAARVIANVECADWSMPEVDDDTWPVLRERNMRTARAALTAATEEDT